QQRTNCAIGEADVGLTRSACRERQVARRPPRFLAAVARSRSGWLDDQHQVGVAGLQAVRGQQCVRLAAVMGLMIEEMRDQEPERPTHLALRRAGEPYKVLG